MPPSHVILRGHRDIQESDSRTSLYPVIPYLSNTQGFFAIYAPFFHMLLYLENTSYPSLQSLGLSLTRDKMALHYVSANLCFFLSSIPLNKAPIYTFGF